MVCVRIGVPAEQQRLVFEGAQLEDGHAMSEYGLRNESTLHLHLGLLGGRGCWGFFIR